MERSDRWKDWNGESVVFRFSPESFPGEEREGLEKLTGGRLSFLAHQRSFSPSLARNFRS